VKTTPHILNRLGVAPFWNRTGAAVRSFTRSELALFAVLLFIFASCVFGIAYKIDQHFMTQVPARGGALNEGVIGSPRFINPLLAVSDTDLDLSSLVYSGLMRVGSDGSLIPDLAQSYTVSASGTVYTFKIRPDAKFQDGTPVTADDVVFTVQEAQNPDLKSPKRANWEGVTVQKIDNLTVSFTIAQPYSPFLQNTTLGILPEHIWKGAQPDEFIFSEYNLKPIGSGPYKVTDIADDSSGVPLTYTLSAFDGFALGKPFISNIVFHFYNDETGLVSAYENGDVDSVSSLSASSTNSLAAEQKDAGSPLHIDQFPLPRDLGVFFNQNQNPIFAQSEVREALNVATDRQAIIDQALDGYGTPLFGPIPPNILPIQTISATGTSTSAAVGTSTGIVAQAQSILTAAGWVQDSNGIFELAQKGKPNLVLAFTISTSDTPEFKDAANLLAQQWDAIGAAVTVQIYDATDLNQNVIRPRKYDALFFGEAIGRDLDFYGFWNSSQRNDPGLNIAMYANSTVDKLLDDSRTTTDENQRLADYKAFEAQIVSDVPAVFVYAPDFIYIVPNDLQGLSLNVTTPEDRFNNVYQWYLDTDHVWKTFAPKQ